MSTTTSPLFIGPADATRHKRGEDAGDDGVGRVVARETGGEAMAAATLLLGDAAHVDVAHRAQADPPRTVGPFLHHARNFGFARPAHDVDQALDLFVRHVVARELGLRHLRPHEVLLGHEHRAGEDLGEELQVREAVLLEQRAAQAGDGQIERGELACEVEHFGRRRVVLEASGVAHQRGVQAHRGVAGQRQSGPGDEAPHEHPTGRRGRIDHVDRAVALVRHVMVDDDELGRGLGVGFEVAEAGQRARVEGHHQVGFPRELFRWCQQLEPGQLAVVGRDDERFRVRRDRIATGRTEHVVQREHRTERITVGADVARERDARRPHDRVGGARQRIVDVLEFPRLAGTHCMSLSVSKGTSPRRISSMRCPARMPGSGWKWSAGT